MGKGEAKHNEALLRRLREADVAASRRQAMSAASGIADDAVLDRLMGLGVSSETVAALSMVPLVAVAWADGSLDEREQTAILSGAADAGVDRNGPSYELLGQWLRHPPPPELLDAWTAYVGAVVGMLDHAARRTLRDDLLNRARLVAEAAGGFLGVGRKVSLAEDAALERLEAALRQPTRSRRRWLQRRACTAPIAATCLRMCLTGMALVS